MRWTGSRSAFAVSRAELLWNSIRFASEESSVSSLDSSYPRPDCLVWWARADAAAASKKQRVFTEPERLALAGFLAGHTGLTREAYALHLRQYVSWCQRCHPRLFQVLQVRRADIECFARDMEARGRARVTITRRLCTIAGCSWAGWAGVTDLWDGILGWP